MLGRGPLAVFLLGDRLLVDLADGVPLAAEQHVNSEETAAAWRDGPLPERRHFAAHFNGKQAQVPNSQGPQPFES